MADLTEKVMQEYDAGQIQMRWRRGSRLALIPGVDSFRIIGHEEHV